MSAPLKLHIGGTIAKEGWKVLNIQPGPHVDYVGDCLDLSRFGESTIAELYLSHVLEHLDYKSEAGLALQEFRRVLVPGGRLMIGVPDLEVLSYLLLAPFFDGDTKFFVMRMMFGGQMDRYDYHKAGYTYAFLHNFLQKNGFERIRRVPSFGLFIDATEIKYQGVPISLNVEAFKPA